MNMDTDTFAVTALPGFIRQAEVLSQVIKQLSYEEAKSLWKCNDKLAELNFERFAQIDLRKNLTPAILAYEGLQYQHMAPKVFTEKAINYVQEHLRILSGFYGLLAPFDGVTPYRLEMQAKLYVDGKKNLYDFWGESLYQELLDEDRIILNLASKEYSQAIEKYIQPQDTFVTIEFGELVNGKVKQKGTLAKMARGEMVRFLAENQINDLDRIKEFTGMGLHFSEEWSDAKTMVFI